MQALTPEIREKIQQMVDENQQLKRNLRISNEQLRLKEGVLNEYENEITDLREAQKSSTTNANAIKELESQSKYLRELVDEKTTELGRVTVELDSTKRQLIEAEKLIRELEAPQSAHDYTSSSSEPSNSAEIAKLQDDLNDAIFKVASSELREKTLKEQFSQLSAQLVYVEEENKDYKKTLKEIKEKNLELECQLSELQTQNPHAKQGNSMFGEVADEYKKLEEETRELVKQIKVLKRENTHLKNEVEEARLLATNRERQEKIGRCVCDELKPELEEQRLRGDHLQRKIHTLEAQIHKFGKGVNAQDVGRVFKVSFDSLKSQLDIANKEVIDLRIERNALKDRNSSLAMMVNQAQNQEKIAHEEVKLLKTQIELIRNNHAKEIAKMENPALYEKDLAEPKVSQTFATAADTLAKLKKSTPNVAFATPAKPPAVPAAFSQTPAPEDALRRLTLNNSASQSLLDASNTTLTARERRLKKEAGKKGICKQLVDKFVPIEMVITKDGMLIKENVEASNNANDTMAMFEGSSNLPTTKFKVPSVHNKSTLPPTPVNLNQTMCAEQSMVLETTHIFDTDFEKNPFVHDENDPSRS